MNGIAVHIRNAPAGSRPAAAAVVTLLISHRRFSQLNDKHRSTMEG